jgi:integrase
VVRVVTVAVVVVVLVSVVPTVVTDVTVLFTVTVTSSVTVLVVVTTDVAVVVSILVVVLSRVWVAVSVTVVVTGTVERVVNVSVWVTGTGTEAMAVVVAVVAITGEPPKFSIRPAPIMKPTRAASRKGMALPCPAIRDSVLKTSLKVMSAPYANSMEELLRRWHESLLAEEKCRPGSTTWEIYRRWALDFSESTGVSLGEFLGMPNEEKRELLKRYILVLKERGLSTNTRAQALAAIKSFLRHNDVFVQFSVKTEAPMPKDLVRPEEILGLLRGLEARPTPVTVATAAFVLVAKDSGLSIATLLSLTWEGGSPYYVPIRVQLAKDSVPIHVRVRRGKTGVVHDSFIGPEGAWGLRRLLEYHRIEPARASGNIFPLERKVIYMTMYRYSKKSGRPISPKDLRKFFITRMKLARTEIHPAAWDIMVEHMAEHSVGRVQYAYFQSQLSPERLKEYYMASYGAIRLGYPS